MCEHIAPDLHACLLVYNLELHLVQLLKMLNVLQCCLQSGQGQMQDQYQGYQGQGLNQGLNQGQPDQTYGGGQQGQMQTVV